MDGTPDYFGCGGIEYALSAGRPNMSGLVDLSLFGVPDGGWVDACFMYGGANIGSWGDNVGGDQDTLADMNGDGTIDPKITPPEWNFSAAKYANAQGMGCIHYVLFGDGDIDGNGAVGLGDFSIFAGTYGKQAEVDWDFNRAADIDENRVVGLGDFSLFAGLYGTTYAYTVTGMDQVPEPATTALAALGALAALRRRRN
jgi:MYXO-CTERM domain-containing protein